MVTLELYRYVYITKRLWYRLQRRRFMNYLELYRSAYTTKRLWYRLQWSGYTLELIDMSTSPKGFRIAYKEGFMNYLELYRSAYTTKRLWYRLQWSGYTLELYRYAYITKKTLVSPTKKEVYELFRAFIHLPTPTKRLGYRLQTMVVINKSLIDLHTPLNDLGITYKDGGLWTI